MTHSEKDHSFFIQRRLDTKKGKTDGKIIDFVGDPLVGFVIKTGVKKNPNQSQI